MRNVSHSKQLVKTLLVFGALTAFAVSCSQRAGKTPVTITTSEPTDPISARVSTKNFDTFSHKTPEHTQFACNTCHQREGRSLKIGLSGHESCIGCHMNQFTNRDDQAKVFCGICHSNTKSDSPGVKIFPANFVEGFNMRFDHAAHMQGNGRPAEGCVSCHKPSGPGQSIPAGITAHNNCYTCHTPESKIGSCNVCHQLSPYKRTLQSQYNFKAIFRHGDHNRGISCNECHSVVAGVPNSRQVTNISFLEHRTTPGNNCLQCHDGKRAFDGNSKFEYSSCSKCHKGAGFGKLPPDTPITRVDTASPF
jgi:c(7)-type cytochrome triheme protein